MQKLQIGKGFQKKLLNGLADGIIVTDSDGEFLFTNQSAVEIVGKDLKNICSVRWTSSFGFFHMDKINQYLTNELALALVINSNVVKDKVIFIKNQKRPEGCFIEASASSLKDNTGKNRGEIIIFHDITQHIIATEKLKNNSGILQQSGESTIHHGGNNNIESVNPGHEKTMGHLLKDSTGTRSWILKTGKNNKESDKRSLNTIRNWNPIYNDAYLLKPYNTEKLLLLINDFLNIRKRFHENFKNWIVNQKVEKDKQGNLNEKFMNQVKEIIEKHLSDDQFCIDEFNKEIGMGRVQIYRKLKALTGKSPSRYIRSIRLAKAKNMIEEKKGTISEIAYSVGFSSPAYFSRCFKEEFGYPPKELK